MMPERRPETRPETALHSCCLITDGNSHRADLCAPQIGFDRPDMVSEAMLPQIRAVAVMIAASRHRFDAPSPAGFTEEADWFAARILVLKVRMFHLDVSLNPMLRTANHRAAEFARRHNLPFQPAAIRPSLHSRRPANMLLAECALAQPVLGNMWDNSRSLCKSIGKIV